MRLLQFIFSDRSGEESIRRYLDAVERQCAQYEKLFTPYAAEFSELTIGGGTPLLLGEGQMERVFDCLKKYFCLEKGREIVIETAPNQTNRKKLEILVREGVTRVSMGIQSFSDQELSVLGRRHGAKPGQRGIGTDKDLWFSLCQCGFYLRGSRADGNKSACFPERSPYFCAGRNLFVSLICEAWRPHGARRSGAGCGSRLFTIPGSQRFPAGEGFRQDSMRRFVRRGGKREFSECGLGTSLALGCGGRSYVGKLHFCSPYAITGKECLKRLEEYEKTVDFTDVRHGILLSEEEIQRRYLIRHLLIYPGVDIQKYESCFGSGLMEDFPVLQDWMEEGWVRWNDSQEKRCKRKAGESSLL